MTFSDLTTDQQEDELNALAFIDRATATTDDE